MKWEYKLAYPDLNISFSEYLDNFGEKGWELVQVIEGGESTFLVFKRPKRPANIDKNATEEAVQVMIENFKAAAKKNRKTK